MHKLEHVADNIRHNFDIRTAARDKALAQARQLTRACSLAIRAVHRDDTDGMDQHLAEAHKLAETLTTDLQEHPDLFFAGYTQDALKEYVEANVTCALIQNQPLLTPEELGVVDATYLNGLAEVVGELRRRILDILRHGYSEEAERLLSYMDEIYSVLVTMDYYHQRPAPSNRHRSQHHRKDTWRYHLQSAWRAPGTGYWATQRPVERSTG